MQQKNHEGDSDIINKVVRAAGVGSQPYNKGEGKRCHEQNVDCEGRGKGQHPRKEPDEAERAADEAAEKEMSDSVKTCSLTRLKKSLKRML